MPNLFLLRYRFCVIDLNNEITDAPFSDRVCEVVRGQHFKERKPSVAIHGMVEI